MKHIRTAVILACLGLDACGAKNDLPPEQAAHALQALVEIKSSYDNRDEGDASVRCAESGRVKGITKGTERYRAAKGTKSMLELQDCGHHSIVIDGSVSSKHTTRSGQDKNEDVSLEYYEGAIFLRGSVQGSCDIQLTALKIGNVYDTVVPKKSTFCGHDLQTLFDLLKSPPDKASRPVGAADDQVPPPDNDESIISDIAETIETEDVADETPADPMSE